MKLWRGVFPCYKFCKTFSTNGIFTCSFSLTSTGKFDENYRVLDYAQIKRKEKWKSRVVFCCQSAISLQIFSITISFLLKRAKSFLCSFSHSIAMDRKYLFFRINIIRLLQFWYLRPTYKFRNFLLHSIYNTTNKVFFSLLSCYQKLFGWT